MHLLSRRRNRHARQRTAQSGGGSGDGPLTRGSDSAASAQGKRRRRCAFSPETARRLGFCVLRSTRAFSPCARQLPRLTHTCVCLASRRLRTTALIVSRAAGVATRWGFAFSDQVSDAPRAARSHRTTTLLHVDDDGDDDLFDFLPLS